MNNDNFQNQKNVVKMSANTPEFIPKHTVSPTPISSYGSSNNVYVSSKGTNESKNVLSQQNYPNMQYIQPVYPVFYGNYQISTNNSYPYYGMNSQTNINNMNFVPNQPVMNVNKDNLNFFQNQYNQNERDTLLKLNIYSIDVECIATGKRHCDRSPARVALVNACSEVLLLTYIKPVEPIVSYLTDLTGITEKDLKDADPLPVVVDRIRSIMPSNSTLVGQTIDHDINWLGLRKGIDYQNSIDLTKVFRVYKNTLLRGYIFTNFSLRLEVKTIFGVDIQSGTHDPSIDAIYSVKLYLFVKDMNQQELNSIRYHISQAPRLPSVAFNHPNGIDGVSLTFDKNCGPTCKSPAEPEITSEDICPLYTPLPYTLHFQKSLIVDKFFEEYKDFIDPSLLASTERRYNVSNNNKSSKNIKQNNKHENHIEKNTMNIETQKTKELTEEDKQ